MPIQTERPSLKLGLLERYNTQKCGGAYDAKSITGIAGTRMPVYSSDGNGTCLASRMWTGTNFLVKMPTGESEFNDVPKGFQGLISKELSIYIQGFTNKKYKP